MKIGIHSDLHTELSLCTIRNLAELDVLLLAGDIGNPTTLRLFFDYLRRKAPDLPVLYVLGNHEFYGFALGEARDIYRTISEAFNITLLDDESITIDGVRFIGSTLWSDFQLAAAPAAAMQWAGKVLYDFRYIYDDKGQLLTPAEMCKLHRKSRKFLSRALQQTGEEKTVVLSHFLPRKELIAKQHHRSNDGYLQSAYWSNHLPELTAKADIWVYGHSHTNISLYIENTRFISNQRGYSKVFDAAAQNDYRQDHCLIL